MVHVKVTASSEILNLFTMKKAILSDKIIFQLHLAKQIHLISDVLSDGVKLLSNMKIELRRIWFDVRLFYDNGHGKRKNLFVYMPSLLIYDLY